MPDGACSRSSSFSARVCGAWSVARQSTLPSLRPASSAWASLWVRSGGATLYTASKLRSASSVSSRWWGQTSQVTFTPCALAALTSSRARAVERCWMCSRPPVMRQISMSRAMRAASAAAGLPGSPSASLTGPSFITPPARRPASSACTLTTLPSECAYSRPSRSVRAFSLVRPSSVNTAAPASASRPSSASCSPSCPRVRAAAGRRRARPSAAAFSIRARTMAGSSTTGEVLGMETTVP